MRLPRKGPLTPLCRPQLGTNHSAPPGRASPDASRPHLRLARGGRSDAAACRCKAARTPGSRTRQPTRRLLPGGRRARRAPGFAQARGLHILSRRCGPRIRPRDLPLRSAGLLRRPAAPRARLSPALHGERGWQAHAGDAQLRAWRRTAHPRPGVRRQGLPRAGLRAAVRGPRPRSKASTSGTVPGCGPASTSSSPRPEHDPPTRAGGRSPRARYQHPSAAGGHQRRPGTAG